MTTGNPNSTGSPGAPFRTCSRTIAALLRVMSIRYHVAIIYGGVGFGSTRARGLRQTVNSVTSRPCLPGRRLSSRRRMPGLRLGHGRRPARGIRSAGARLRNRGSTSVAPRRSRWKGRCWRWSRNGWTSTATAWRAISACTLTAREGPGFVRYLEGGFYGRTWIWSDRPGGPMRLAARWRSIVFLGSSTAPTRAALRGRRPSALYRWPDAARGGGAAAGNAGRVPRQAASRGHGGPAWRDGTRLWTGITNGFRLPAPLPASGFRLDSDTSCPDKGSRCCASRSVRPPFSLRSSRRRERRWRSSAAR